MGPEIVVPLGFFATAAFCVVVLSVTRLLSRRGDGRRLCGDSAEVLARLERMEQAIDAVAVEVERISEAQRFTTKLLSDKSGAPGRT